MLALALFSADASACRVLEKRCKLGPDISLVFNYYLTILTVKPFTLSIAQSKKKKMSKEKKLQDTLLQTSEPLNTDPCFFYSRE